MHIGLTGAKSPSGKPVSLGYTPRGTRATGLAVLDRKTFLQVGSQHPLKGTFSEALTTQEAAVMDFGSLIDQSEDATITFYSATLDDSLVMNIRDLNVTKYKVGDNAIDIDNADIQQLLTALQADWAGDAIIQKAVWKE